MPNPHAGVHYATLRVELDEISEQWRGDGDPLAKLIIISLVTCATIPYGTRVQQEVKSSDRLNEQTGTLPKPFPRAKQIEGCCELVCVLRLRERRTTLVTV